MNSVYNLAPYLVNIRFNIIITFTLGTLLSRLVASSFLAKIFHEFPLSPMRATCTFNLILDVIVLIKFDEDAPDSCRFPSVGAKHSFQRLVIKHPQSPFFH